MLYYEDKMWTSVGVGVMAKSLGTSDIAGAFTAPFHDEPGNIVIGGSSAPGNTHYGYGYSFNELTGVAAVVENLVPKEHWLHDALLSPNLVVEALYRAYGTNAYRYVKDTLTDTVRANPDIVRAALRNEERLVSEIQREVDTFSEDRFPMVVVREEHFLAPAVAKVMSKAALETNIEPVVVSINVTPKSSYLLARGNQQEALKYIFSDCKIYAKDEGTYIMLPGNKQDMSIDEVVATVNKAFNY